MDATLGRRLVAEALGTALLIVFGPGTVVADLRVGDGELDYAGPGMISLGFGPVVALVIAAEATTPAYNGRNRDVSRWDQTHLPRRWTLSW